MKAMVNRLLRSVIWVELLLCCGWPKGVPLAEGRAVDLVEGVRLAMEKNERLLMARVDLSKSQQQVRQARADGLPRLDLFLDYGRNWMLSTFIFDTPEGQQTVKIGTKNSIIGSFRVSQKLYAGGRVKAALVSARLFDEYSREAQRSVRQQVIVEIESTFYDLLLAREMVQVNKLALERARYNLAQVQGLRRAGRVSDYDLLRAKVQISSLCSDSIRVENGYLLAEMAFKEVIGLELGEVIEIEGNFRESTQLDLESPARLLEMGIVRRPEMNQMENQLRMRRRDIQIEKADSRPSVDLLIDGQTQFQSNEFDVVDRKWRRSWRTGIVVQFPLFDGMRSGSRVAQARMELRREEFERDRLERAIRLEINQAWFDVQEAKERMEAQGEVVGQAEKGLQVAESRYASGVGTQLEILDAQLSLVQVRTELVTARRDRALALVVLERSVGVLGEGGQ